jgi:membrane protease subunit (stomatin/prohibitin family)
MPSVIEAFDNSGTLLVERLPANGSGEWELGSQLIVQENQVGIFWRDGKDLDGFKPGRHTIETANVPKLGGVIGSGFGGKSPFRACVYFVSTKVFPSIGWGTSQPVTFRDTDFGMVPVRAFGSYSIRITKPRRFMGTIVGTQGLISTDEINQTLRSFIISRFTKILGDNLTAIVDLPSQYDTLALKLKEAVREEFDQYGITLVDLLLEAVTPPPEVQKMIEKAAGMNIQDVDRYQKLSAADAMVEGAKNPAGGAAAGIGAGLGAGLGIAMGQQMAGQAPTQPVDTPPPVQPANAPPPTNQPASMDDMRQKLTDLKKMFEDGLLDEEEYKTTKTAILKGVNT